MRKRIIVLGLTAALLLGGCGVQMPNMTDEQAQMIGEYAAITLLKYDANSRSRLVELSEEEPKEEEIPEEEQVPELQPEEPEPAISDTPVIEIGEEVETTQSMEEFLGLAEGIAIYYAGSEICQDYSGGESDFFVLEASPGKSLLVLNFIFNNESGAEQTINLLDRRDVYRITVNQDYTRTALMTMLTNDMSTYKGTIGAGEKAGVVLLIEIEQEQANSLTSIALKLKNDSNEYTIQLE